MPMRKPKTKAEKQNAVGEVMGEFKRGSLRSGSRRGPKVKNPKQAKAIAMSEAGMSRKPRRGGGSSRARDMAMLKRQRMM